MDACEFFNVNETGQLVRDKIGIVLAQDLASALYGKTLVDQTQLDLFAARLYHESPELYAAFREAFPTANAGTFIG